MAARLTGQPAVTQLGGGRKMQLENGVEPVEQTPEFLDVVIVGTGGIHVVENVSQAASARS